VAMADAMNASRGRGQSSEISDAAILLQSED
jgi:hypothetical protein